jgi:uncharacterized membrane protein YedE/YeeE
VNTAWTNEQIKESVRSQKKALLIAIPIIPIVLFALMAVFAYILHHWFMEPPEYHLQIEQLIKRGYLNSDYTNIEYLDFCENIEKTLYDTYDYVCRWID